MPKISRRRWVWLSVIVVACLIIAILASNWTEIRIRWLISRIGKDEYYVSGHLAVDASGRELKKIGRRAVPYLVRAINNPNENVRREIVLTLWGIGDKSAAPALLQSLSDSSPHVREMAILAVARIGIKEGIPRLRVMAQSADEHTYNRRAALWALGHLGDEASRPVLLRALEDPDPSIRRDAADGLAALEQQHALKGALPAEPAAPR